MGRDGKPVPYEWMTINSPKFYGDSHESSAHWFGMTVLFDARSFLDKFQFVFFPRETDMRILSCPGMPGAGVFPFHPAGADFIISQRQKKATLKDADRTGFSF